MKKQLCKSTSVNGNNTCFRLFIVFVWIFTLLIGSYNNLLIETFLAYITITAIAYFISGTYWLRGNREKNNNAPLVEGSNESLGENYLAVFFP